MIGVSTYFKKLHDKNKAYIFYPFGPLKLGFIIDENKKITIENFKKLYFAALSLAVAIRFLIYEESYLLGFHMLSILFIGIILGIIITRLILLECNKSNLKLSFKERRNLLLDQEKAESHLINFFSSLILFGFSLSFFLEHGINHLLISFIELLAIVYYIISAIDSFLLIKDGNFSNKKI